ncbi:hypothetical protein SAMN05661091_5376 [Paenibacillus uliginis N3/975]|uniref:Uncharacterized protein n=1 Tax=Paenibacillus uliginis N3/975 TaxID=1313296 RepID=A0A1X7HQS3_9BACL|nr:hypothetical protein [Paenibacillus uliginis]SMF91208.1 hypothetical protein SAMN05661091_5376 [Paenibacillus uliginis N3/975]
MKTNEITAAEGDAIIRIIDTLPLLEQITTYRRPGDYGFRKLFPTEYAHFTWDAALLKESRVQVVQRFGYWAATIAEEMTETDRIHSEYAFGSRQSRKQMMALSKAATKFERAYHALVKEVTR